MGLRAIEQIARDVIAAGGGRATVLRITEVAQAEGRRVSYFEVSDFMRRSRRFQWVDDSTYTITPDKETP